MKTAVIVVLTVLMVALVSGLGLASITFTDTPNNITPVASSGLALGDFDNDGDLDVAVNQDGYVIIELIRLTYCIACRQNNNML